MVNTNLSDLCLEPKSHSVTPCDDQIAEENACTHTQRLQAVYAKRKAEFENHLERSVANMCKLHGRPQPFF